MPAQNRTHSFFVVFPALFAALACVIYTDVTRAEENLPSEDLAYFQDSFDKLRLDLWEKGGMLYSQEQMENFRLADTRIVDGKFVITTKIGGFSKGGLVSTFSLRGDFDIQLDCEMEFLEGPIDMDQLVLFAIYQRGRTPKNINLAQVGLNKQEGYLKKHIYCIYFIEGKKKRIKPIKTEDFDGAFRFVRKKDNLSVYYKKQSDRAWSKITDFSFTTEDLVLGFEVQNFVANKKYVKASKPFKAAFDNFKINAAEGVVESDI
jgi:hypothetical protein